MATLVGHGFAFVSARIVATEPAFFNTADRAPPDGLVAVASSTRLQGWLGQYVPLTIRVFDGGGHVVACGTFDET